MTPTSARFRDVPRDPFQSLSFAIAAFCAPTTWRIDAWKAASGSRFLMAFRTARISLMLPGSRFALESDTRRSCVMRAFMVRSREGMMTFWELFRRRLFCEEPRGERLQNPAHLIDTPCILRRQGRHERTAKRDRIDEP